MEEQVNIPALCVVCFCMRIGKRRALYGYTSRKGKTEASAKVNSSHIRCLEKYKNVRRHKIVPQTDSGGWVE